jgi:DNA invertase Pin-like site-specific DNA recombinase
MKAILIARVSTEEQKEAGNSLPAQVARLEQYCQRRGFEILQICSFDESAYKSKRTEFDKIIDFILEQKEKIVVCCDKVDRLSRNVFDKRISALYEKALSDHIELHFTSEGQIINSKISAVEKFQFGISLGLAKYYSDAIGDNVKRAIEQKLRNGEWISKAPYGYVNKTVNDTSKEIVIDDYAAHIVRKAFELYATGAYSMALLCKKMKDDYGISWTVSFLDKVFKNHFYYGVMVVKEKQYPHKYPPLISQALFEQVQDVKKSYNKKKYKYAGKPYIYRGLIRCAHCGLAITPEKHKGFVYYHCTQYNGKHDAKWLREEEITRQLATVFKRMQMPLEIAEQIKETLEQTHKDKIEFQKQHYDKLIKEHKSLTSMLDNLYMDKLKGRITESEYDRFYQNLRGEVTDIAIRLEQLQEADDNYFITTKHIIDLANRSYDLFVSSEVEEKRVLIKFLLSNLQLKESYVVWEANKPFDVLLENADYTLWRI